MVEVHHGMAGSGQTDAVAMASIQSDEFGWSASGVQVWTTAERARPCPTR